MIRVFKKSVSAVLAVFMGLMLLGCSQNHNPEKTKIVSVSIPPLGFLTDQLSGNSLDVNIMVPTGASHATYSPSVSQMQKLSDSDVYFRISSLGYEQAFLHRLDELNERMEVVDLAQGVDLIRGVVEHGDHVHEGGNDPHIWMSPKVMLTLLSTVKNALAGSYPDMKLTLEENYERLYAEISSIDSELEELSNALTQKQFMIFHPALTYLARDYGLEQIAIEHEGKEPSPARLMEIVRESKALEVPVIFIQQEYDKRNAMLVSQETGAEVVQINPMAYNWMESMQNLIETFRQHMQ